LPLILKPAHAALPPFKHAVGAMSRCGVNKIKDADFQPAIEEGMRLELVEVEKIASNPAAPTFANTIEAMEHTGDVLGRAQRAFNAMTQAIPIRQFKRSSQTQRRSLPRTEMRSISTEPCLLG
jgi:Zn-dependent oligopeptidase